MSRGMMILLVALTASATFLSASTYGQSVTALINRAIDLFYEGKYYEALAQLDRAVSVAPNNASAHLWIGIVNAESGLNNQRAVAALNRVLTLTTPGSPEAAQAQRWLLRLQGRPKSLIISFFATDPRYDSVNSVIVEGITRQIGTERVYSYEIIRGSSGGGPIGSSAALLDFARRRGAGWVLKGALRRVRVEPSLFQRGRYLGALNLDVSLIDAVIGNTVAEFDGGEGSTEPDANRALDLAVSRTSAGIWPKVSTRIKDADEQVKEELNRISIRLRVPNVYAFAARMDRPTANTLPKVVVPVFRTSTGASTESRDDATEAFTRLFINLGRFSVIPESELFHLNRIRSDTVDQEALIRDTQRLGAKYVVIGEITRLQVKSQFALIGTNIEVDAAIKIRVSSAEGVTLGEVAAARKSSRVLVLRTEGQVKDQEVLFRNALFAELARELVGKIEGLFQTGPRRISPEPVAPPPAPSPTPFPQPAPSTPPSELPGR